jgi:predicted MFS family arabinose efflux permease
MELVNLNTVLVLTSDRNRTQFAAINSAVLTVAAMVGPLLGGALSDRVGFAPVFLLGSGLSLVGCALYYVFVPNPTAPGDGVPQPIA